MSHLRISVPFTVRANEHQSVKVLARRFSGINDYVTAVGVQCPTCRVLEPCRESVMADVKLRRAYAAVEAVIGGLPPAQLRRRRKVVAV